MKDKKIVILLISILAAILILGVLITVSFNQAIAGIKSELANVNTTLTNQITALETQRGSMITSVKGMFGIYDDPIAHYSVTYGLPDTKTLMCEVTVSVTPRQYTADTAMELVIGDKSVNMIDKNKTYTAAVSVPVSDAPCDAYVTFKQGGKVQTAMLPEKVDAGGQLANRLTVEPEIILDNKNQSYFVSGGVRLSFPRTFPDKVESINVVAYANNNEIWRQKIRGHDGLGQDNDKHGYTLESDSFGAPNKEAVSIYIEVCCSGFMYRKAIVSNSSTDLSGVFDYDGNRIEFYNDNQQT